MKGLTNRGICDIVFGLLAQTKKGGHMAKDNRDTILIVVVRDEDGDERLMPYRVEGEKLEAGIAGLEEEMDPGDTVARHYVLPKHNYFIKHILSLSELGDGDACADALGEFEELISVITPAIRELN